MPSLGPSANNLQDRNTYRAPTRTRANTICSLSVRGKGVFKLLVDLLHLVLLPESKMGQSPVYSGSCHD